MVKTEGTSTILKLGPSHFFIRVVTGSASSLGAEEAYQEKELKKKKKIVFNSDEHACFYFTPKFCFIETFFKHFKFEKNLALNNSSNEINKVLFCLLV